MIRRLWHLSILAILKDDDLAKGWGQRRESSPLKVQLATGAAEQIERVYRELL